MKIAITGHRPEDLPDVKWVRNTLKEVLDSLQPEILIQGMAAGVDLMSGEVAMELGIPVISARPWGTHTPRNEDKGLYKKVSEGSQEVVIVSDAKGYSGPHLYHIRNEYMVDRADVLLAVWTGKNTGGTAACVRYAKKKGVRIIQINPLTKKVILNEEETLF